MKHSAYLLLIIIILSAFTSCKKQLNSLPTDFITSVNYYTNEEQLNGGLAGVYSILGSSYLYQDALLHNMSHNNDEAVFVFNQAPLVVPSNFSYSSSDPNITGMWNVLYQGINNANIIIAAADNPKAQVSQAVRDNIRAQALFLRAYYHFLLVDKWGKVPMMLAPAKSSFDVNLAASPIAEIYEQILKDMTAAEAVLPQASVLGANSSGRLSKNTAQGILARVCLSMTGFPLNDESKYAAALAWSSKVISTGDNALNPSYADLFVKQARDEYDVKENMWEVEFYGNVSDNYREQGYVGIRNGIQAANGRTFPGFGYNFLQASVILYNKYQVDPLTSLSKDLRRERNIAPYQWVGGSAAVQVMTKSYWPKNGNLYQRWPGKWRRDEELRLPRFQNGNGTNFPLLRYADVLLMFAEAENYINGPTVAAYNAMNKVRERAYGTGYRVSDIVITNGGTGYTAAPVVTIGSSGDPNGASTAEAYATVTNGAVTQLTLVNMGGFYTATPPTVTITSANGLGSGATATATVSPIVVAEADLPTGLTKAQFFEHIVDERSRELAYEALRSHDLRRWGRLISTMQTLATIGPSVPGGVIRNGYTSPAVNITAKHLYLPIPPAEIATNALIVQNPGW
ncbi:MULTISPECIES: RagB/SusD family nutrient uptake outer membrane protein [Pedobacter]|uniref:RagB/SusD domain protein n=1 Tax=Pedobacter heparinus (strain ATCC 13125 / DSM 2366 / CIP 104194 / JCM 7457 / NBRC 12017 / NCIMB 9290 / NRRL B-14731 / HIM 762-3) TaxID=485917 RepID=C6Y2W6_PEDHD|nr:MULTISPECIES: RagB/SusD family nutrient uptake outer membrane protein [Pedobacter]ACU03179.1 RagB/SusD domain protein [Pedobacter heparinus DSM 2366]MBB5438593.1 hypothetical protein [Pedobacter sp. AK017]